MSTTDCTTSTGTGTASNTQAERTLQMRRRAHECWSPHRVRATPAPLAARNGDNPRSSSALAGSGRSPSQRPVCAATLSHRSRTAKRPRPTNSPRYFTVTRGAAPHPHLSRSMGTRLAADVARRPPCPGPPRGLGPRRIHHPLSSFSSRHATTQRRLHQKALTGRWISPALRRVHATITR